MKYIKYLIITLLSLCVIGWLGIKDVLQPVQPEKINQKVYTIGDSRYQQALSDGKNIVKFGKAFWGLYPGGLAFKSPDEAIIFIQENQHILDRFSSGWAIYELSGDYQQHIYLSGEQGYLKESMLVIRQVPQS